MVKNSEKEAVNVLLICSMFRELIRRIKCIKETNKFTWIYEGNVTS
jgi:hypothetical protein